MSKIKSLLVDLKTLGGANADEVRAELDAIEAAKVQNNANEVMNTSLVAGGKELVPVDVMGDALLDLVPNYSYLLPVLPGNHGSGLEKSEILPVVGEADIFQGNSEWTTGSSAITPDGSKVTTGQVTVTQGQYILNIAISKRELAYSAVALEGRS